MTHVKLAEYMDTGSIWGSIEALYPSPLYDLFTVDLLDAQLDIGYGERLMVPKLAIKTPTELAPNIAAMFSSEWDKLLKAHELPISIGSGGSNNTVETGNKSETRNNNRDDVNKVSAYNSDELVVNDGANSISLDTLSGADSKTVTNENISLQNAISNLTIIQKSNILSIVTRDVALFLTLSIY